MRPAVVSFLTQGSGGTFFFQVPGAFELPRVAKHVQDHAVNTSGMVTDAIICIGCLIKGETMHFEYISEAVCQGIMRLNTRDGPHHAERWYPPVIFGVLECLNEEQALTRSGLLPGGHNHGIEWAQSALRMANVISGSCEVIDIHRFI